VNPGLLLILGGNRVAVPEIELLERSGCRTLVLDRDGLRTGPPLPTGSQRALTLRGMAMLAGLMPPIRWRRRGSGHPREERYLRSFSCLPAGGRGGLAEAAAGERTPADAGLALGREGAPAASGG
jgi:hypothetical protein